MFQMNEDSIKKDDYIELPPLKKIAIQFFSGVFYIVDLIFDIIKKSKLLLITGLVTGLAVGFAYYSSKPAYYEVSMIAESSVVYRKTLAEMIQSLNDLITSGSSKKLATELRIGEQQADQLIQIDMSSLTNESLEKDTSTRYNQPFKITARIKQTELTDTFQHALVDYLDNKPQLKKTKEDQVQFYHEKISFIDKELAKLDTLKTEYNRFFGSSRVNTTYFANTSDPANAYKQANDLITEKGTLLYWLSTNSRPLQVIDEFKSSSVPQSKSLFKSLRFFIRLI